jgi:UDP-N-acetylglucosamine acyltransferase
MSRRRISVHPTAVVEEGAVLGDNVTIGPFSIVGPRVRIGDDAVLHSHVVVTGNTTIGRNARIYPFATIGHPGQDLKYHDDTSGRIEIGDNALIREHATVNPGTPGGRGVTRMGNDCVLLIGAHVAHDCVVGDHVVLINNVMLGGHCVIGDHVIIGGGTGIHQYVRVGEHAFVGGISAVVDDVIPFGSAFGNRAVLGGLNIVGMKRRGFEREQIHALRRAYRLLFSNEGTLAERVEDLARMFGQDPLVGRVIAFIRAGSDRPLCTPKNGREG